MRYIKEMKKTILIILPILILLIAALIALGITNAANNATEPETEQTFTEDGDGYYIWVRAVDHAGNKGPWSEAQRVWIDTKPPIVSCVIEGSTMTIQERDKYAFEDCFNVEPNGKNKNITTKYTINGTEYEDTSTLTAENSPYTVTCTAIKNGGKSASTTMTVIVGRKRETVAIVVDEKGLALQDTKIKPDEDSNVQIVIPTGFAPAILKGSNSTTSLPGENGEVKCIMPAEEWNNITEEQINQGIVVVNNSITYDGGAETGTVPDFEEYVWVPIPESTDLARVNWGKGSYTTGDELTTDEYNNMKNSIFLNKGFYVGRYESSFDSTSICTVSKRNQTAYSNVLAGSKSYAEANPIKNTSLIYDLQWDSILSWMIGKAIISTKTEGETRIMTLADVNSNSTTWGNYKNSTGDAALNSGIEATTGYSEYWKANNIYDMARKSYRN